MQHATETTQESTMYTVRFTRHFVAGPLAGISIPDTVTRLSRSTAHAIVRQMTDDERRGVVRGGNRQSPSAYTVSGATVSR